MCMKIQNTNKEYYYKNSQVKNKSYMLEPGDIQKCSCKEPWFGEAFPEVLRLS